MSRKTHVERERERERERKTERETGETRARGLALQEAVQHVVLDDLKEFADEVCVLHWLGVKQVSFWTFVRVWFSSMPNARLEKLRWTTRQFLISGVQFPQLAFKYRGHVVTESSWDSPEWPRGASGLIPCDESNLCLPTLFGSNLGPFRCCV